MKRSVIPLILLLFVGISTVSANPSILFEHFISKFDDGTTTHLLDIPDYNRSELSQAILDGEAVVFYGNISGNLPQVYNTSILINGETDYSTPVIANGVWIRANNEHSLIVKRYSSSSKTYNSVVDWEVDIYNDYSKAPTNLYTITEVEFHEPYGIIRTKTELLKVNDSSSRHDWYDVTVTQTLTPGINISNSDWEWDWITYMMNGSTLGSNVFLSDYDSPPTNELPTGLFSFLWRILNFSPRNFFPWLYMEELKVEGIDQSDFSLETFTVRYQAPDGYLRSNEPLEVRHHYVLRVLDGVKPKFWQQTQVKYVRGNVIAAPPYFSPLMHEGYLELR